MQSIKLVCFMGLLGLAAACARQEEEVIFIQPEPISIEPVYTGKYK
jgi:hypothetical protein